MSKHHTAGNGVTTEEQAGEPQDAAQPGTSELRRNFASQNAAGEAAAVPAQDAAGEGAPVENAGGECPAGEQPPHTPEDTIAELEAKLAEANDNYLRKAADFENFRKRMNQEKQSAIDFANQSLLLDLIPVIDDFERAIKAASQSAGPIAADCAECQLAAAFNSLCEGIGMIEKRLVSQLENKWSLKRFDSAGEAFDPARHEAIMMEKSAKITDPVVAEDFVKGYTLKDRVIRAAKVKVIMPENG